MAVFLVWLGDYAQAVAASRNQWSTLLSTLFSPRVIGVLVGMGFMALLAKPIWTRAWGFWWIGGLLRKHVFEDLNGEWLVTIDSNWPAVSALLEAAKADGAKYDPVSEPQSIPQTGRFEFRATIDQGWEKASIEVLPNKDSPLRQSRTFAFDLIKACADAPPRVFWGFRQTNGVLEGTDEDNFLGAALLEVISSDYLEGLYWNNRSWRGGLNAAGRISLSRAPLAE